MKDFYCIDLNRKRPEVLIFPAKEVQLDLDYTGETNPLELTDYDRRVFKTEKQAKTFLKKYMKALRSLKDRKKFCKARGLPLMMLKRRYMVLTLMGLKMQTFRHYRREWKSGQLFNFCDQTFMLTVRLKSISKRKDSDGNYRYDFDLIRY